MHLFQLILIFSLLVSCSTYIDYLEKDENKIVFRETKVKTICETSGKNELILFGENSNSVKEMKSFLELDFNSKLSFQEKAVLWALANLNTNPYLVHPYSRFQIVYKNYGQPKYKEYSLKHPPKKKEILPSSYMTALDKYLRATKANRSLFQLAKHLDLYFESRPRVEKDLAIFLSENQGEIRKDKTLKKRFYKADQILQEGESLRRLKFSKLVKNFRTDKSMKHVTVTDYLFDLSIPSPTDLGKKHNILCNFDPGLYKNDIFLITPESQNGHAFGIMNGKGQFFVAIASAKLNSLKQLSHSFFFDSKSSDRPLSTCLVQDNSKLMVLSSLKGRDPGQYLYNLLNYQIGETSSLDEIDQYLDFPRHIFLPSPARMLFESEKGTKEQLQNFLQTGFPIYQHPKLGKIWSLAVMKKSSGVVIDRRETGQILCQKKR